MKNGSLSSEITRQQVSGELSWKKLSFLDSFWNHELFAYQLFSIKAFHRFHSFILLAKLNEAETTGFPSDSIIDDFRLQDLAVLLKDGFQQNFIHRSFDILHK